jgi:hypothetical protein
LLTAHNVARYVQAKMPVIITGTGIAAIQKGVVPNHAFFVYT